MALVPPPGTSDHAEDVFIYILSKEYSMRYGRAK
jgi:hypothetical protein